MEDLDKAPRYELPRNVTVIRHQIFQPYNRVSIIFSNLALITGIYFSEVLHSKNRFRYFGSFFSTLKNLTHKISAADKLVKELLKLKDQNIITYSYWFNQWAFILSIIHKKHYNYPLFSRIHGMDVYEDQHPEPGFFFQFRNFQLKQIKRILAISENGKNHLLTANNIKADKITVNRLGVNEYGNNPLNISSTSRIVSCSALQPYKRVHLISEILSSVTHKIEWVHFGDGELKEQLLDKTKLLPENITFKFMGHQSSETINSYYANTPVDLFINVSETEGIPVSIMESISFGINAIGPNVGGIAEIINKDTGYLIEKNFSSKEVAGIIDTYLSKNEIEKIEMRKKAKLFWSTNYSAEKNYDALTELLLQ